MANRETFLMNLWRWSAGLEEISTLPTNEEVELATNLCPWRRKHVDGLDVREMASSEWSTEFERLMRNRLLVGAYRYGRIASAKKSQYDRIEAIQVRAAKYQQTGNVDLLADIANLALLEFVEGIHPKRHMSAEEHVESVREVP